MERTEPALIPEWLRCTTGAAHHPDVSSSVLHTGSRFFRNINKKDSPCLLERSSLSNSRRGVSTNGSAKHPYRSFPRNHCDSNCDIEKEKSLTDKIWDHDSSDPLGSILTSRVERTALKHSQSLVSRKPSEILSCRVEDSKNNVINRTSSNAVPSRCLSGIQNTVFEKDFPSLGTEEKQGMTGIRTVLSPCLSSAVQSLPMCNSGYLGSEKWTSALAEVPAVLANNGTCCSPLQQSIATCSTSASGGSCTTGLNMAEALSQPPARVHAAPQLPDKGQRLEELAIKQSRQLIPMTPSMPKPSGSNSVDKSKQLKTAAKNSEIIVASKVVQTQPHSSHLSNQSRAGQVKFDSGSTSHVGKFLVLKPGRENGIASLMKNACSPTGDSNWRNDQHAVASMTPTASIGLNNPMVNALENKASALSLCSRSAVDKRSSKLLAQSRSEFFNLMRRKTLSNATNILSDSSMVVSSSGAKPSGEIVNETPVPVRSHVLESGSLVTCNTGCDIWEKNRNFSDVEENELCSNGALYPDEEEAAFLRSLGWEENGGEDDGLTEEEINAFYQEYMNRWPSLKACRSSPPKCSALVDFHPVLSGHATSESSYSEF